MSIFNNILLGASAQSTTTPVHTIDQSIRFSASDNPYMSKAFSSKGSPKKFTLSWWTKLGERTTSATSESQMFFIAYHSSGYQTDFSIQSAARAGGVAHTFRTYSTTTGGSAVWNFTTTQVFRDPSAWYNFVVVSDTDNDVSTERFKLYVNGQRVTDFSTETYPSSGVEPVWNNSTSVTHYIGSRAANVNTRFDGYMAEMVHIDGQALTPSSFGETNSSGIWVPIDVSGLTFGTNGFHIDGRDSADLGDDESGQGNDFSSSGLASHDQVLDSPTNNFAVLNPISSSGLASDELTGGNLEMRNIDYIDATLPFPTSGKWYYELCVVSKTQGNWNYGNHYFRDIVDGFPDSNFTDYITTNFYHGSNFYSSSNWTDGDFWTNSNNPSAGDIYGFAWDSDTKKLWLAKNNVYFGSGNPAGNSGTPLGSGGTAGVEYVVTLYSTLSQVMTINFGQDDTFNNAKTSGSAGAADGNGNGKFYYAPPTGFLALCTKNLGAE